MKVKTKIGYFFVVLERVPLLASRLVDCSIFFYIQTFFSLSPIPGSMSPSCVRGCLSIGTGGRRERKGRRHHSTALGCTILWIGDVIRGNLFYSQHLSTRESWRYRLEGFLS